MAVDFSALKKNRGQALKDLTKKLESMNSSGPRDERIYKPGFDNKEGKGYAIVRLLPAKEGEELVKAVSHNFKGPGGYYNELSRKTIGPKENDPVAMANSALWSHAEQVGDESLKDICRLRKQTITYYANVYVERDDLNPDAVGQVKIMKFGKQIYKIIQTALKPEFDDESPINPFDMWAGANMVIKMTGNEMPIAGGKKIMVPNYEKTTFGQPSSLFDDDDDKKKEVFEQTHDLSEFVAVKDFDELAERFRKVTGEAHDRLASGSSVTDAISQLEQKAGVKDKPKVNDVDDDSDDLPWEDTSNKSEDKTDDEDDVLAQFQKLASGN